MASAFQRGGRLYVMGNGGGATDAQHVAVEFCHPIVEKRRALPALALTTDQALLTAISNDRDFAKVFGDQGEVLRLAGRRTKAALAFEHAIELYEQKGNVIGAARVRALLDDVALV